MKITNTLTSTKEHFKPLSGSNVLLYVCGITPYDYAHVGHGRCYVTFDILYRFLTYMGYKVTYCRNYTDIDDKILVRAAQQLGNSARYPEITQTFITAYQEDMRQLNCLNPHIEPRVTQTIEEIISFIQGLIEKGKAYATDGDVYYDITTFKNYGALSKQKLSELQAGARVDVRQDKRSALDFALWKKETDPAVAFKSPWGMGRPGWHIECSAMAYHHLGEQIDIHAGGADLIFPHHENEIAQTEGLTEKQFAQYWMHNGFVMVNKEKMSKSLGNFFTLKDVFKQFDPMVVRYYIANHHYRSPMEFSFDDLQSCTKSYQRLATFFAQSPKQKQYTIDELNSDPVIRKMVAFLQDDLNVSGMWGVVFESLDAMKSDSEQRGKVKQFLQETMGMTLVPLPEKEQVLTPEIEALLVERETARKNKNWALADSIRDQLIALGYQVQDKKTS